MSSMPSGKYLQPLSAGVGAGQPNRKHDGALVQAALKLIKDGKGKPFLAGKIDGSVGSGTNTAISRFQTEVMKLVPVPSAEVGKVLPGSATESALANALPADVRLGALPDHKVVYRAATGILLSDAQAALAREPNIQPSFRMALANLNGKLFDRDRLVLAIAPKGGFRSFQEQANLPPSVTGAGPGESNHNFGNGCDFGFYKFAFLTEHGMWQEESYWLSVKLSALGLAKPFWDRRNSYFTGLGLFPSKLPGDLIHVQAFDDSHVSMRKSLADLMTRKSPNCDWDFHGEYRANLIFADTKFPVGTAKQIWAGNATVSAAELAAALEAGRLKRNTPTGSTLTTDQETKFLRFAGSSRNPSKHWTGAEITPAQLTIMRQLLREDMIVAESARADWLPVQ